MNEVESLPSWRRDIENQTRTPDEIIIVDAISTDGTAELLADWAKQDSRVKVVSRHCTVSHGRNQGFSIASHEHVVTTDMGCRIGAEWIEQLMEPFDRNPALEAVVGGYRTEPESVVTPAARAESYISGDGFPFEKTTDGKWQFKSGVVPGNRSVAYTKSLWDRLGRFPEDLTRCADDSVFGRQVLASGCEYALAPEALVYWTRFRELRHFWKEQRGYGLGDGEANIKKPAAFRLHEKGIVPKALVPLLTALRRVQKVSRPGTAWNAIRRGDFIGLAYVPVLAFGNGWNFGSGYVVGHEQGGESCQSVRSRL